jgi:hypothetical protein
MNVVIKKNVVALLVMLDVINVVIKKNVVALLVMLEVLNDVINAVLPPSDVPLLVPATAVVMNVVIPPAVVMNVDVVCLDVLK